MQQMIACAVVLLVFAAVREVSARLGNPVWASPVVLAAMVIALGLAAAGVAAADFVAATAPLRWLLGPAVIALAAVVHGNRAAIARAPKAILLSIGGGMLVGVGSAVLMARLMGLDKMLAMGLATKTVSTPFAVVIAKAGGGPVALAAAAAVTTGVIGAVLVPPLFAALRIKGAARGLAMGVSSHIIGTDSLRRRDAAGGAMAALAMVVAGVMASVLLPLVWRWLFR